MAENAFSNLSIVAGSSERRPMHATQAECRNEIMERPSAEAFWRGQVAVPVYEALEQVVQWMRQNLIVVNPFFSLGALSPTSRLTPWNWWRVMAMLNKAMADQINMLHDYLGPGRLQDGFVVVPRFSDIYSPHQYDRYLRHS